MGHSDRSALTGRGICKTGYVTKKRYDIPVEPKAGKVGVFAVFVFGVLSIVAVFVAAYMWTGADTKLAGAMGVASILIPTIIGLRGQRATPPTLWRFVVRAHGGDLGWQPVCLGDERTGRLR